MNNTLQQTGHTSILTQTFRGEPDIIFDEPLTRDGKRIGGSQNGFGHYWLKLETDQGWMTISDKPYKTIRGLRNAAIKLIK